MSYAVRTEWRINDKQFYTAKFGERFGLFITFSKNKEGYDLLHDSSTKSYADLTLMDSVAPVTQHITCAAKTRDRSLAPPSKFPFRKSSGEALEKYAKSNSIIRVWSSACPIQTRLQGYDAEYRTCPSFPSHSRYGIGTQQDVAQPRENACGETCFANDR